MAEILTLAIAPGDGIGPEISSSVQEILSAASGRFGFDIKFRDIQIGFAALTTWGTTFPDQSIDIAKSCDGLILGPVSHMDYPPREQGGLNPSGEFRKRLDLYANIRPARTRAGISPGGQHPVDLVVCRENTEGFYADRCLYSGPGEFMPTEDTVLSLRRVTKKASLRIARASFIEAKRRKTSGAGPGKVTAVHKANVLRMGDGMFLDCVREVAAEYPDIVYDERIVDAMCAHLVRSPEHHDVICTTNMFGDIISDLASELAGGLGLAASLNAGDDYAMAQAQHGSAPDIAGKDIANPSSLIGSAVLLIEWLGARQGSKQLAGIGKVIDDSLETVLSKPASRTRDLGGPLGTAEFTSRIIEALERASS